MRSTVQQAVDAATTLIAGRTRHKYRALAVGYLEDDEDNAEAARVRASRDKRLRTCVLAAVILFGVCFTVYGVAL